MGKLKELVAGMKHHLTQVENRSEAILALIPVLDRELRVRRLNVVAIRILWKLKEAHNRRWDHKDLRLFLKCNGEVDLIPPFEKSSRLFEIGFQVEECMRALQKAATLIRDGNNVEPFILLNRVTAEERYLSWQQESEGKCLWRRTEYHSVQSVQISSFSSG